MRPHRPAGGRWLRLLGLVCTEAAVMVLLVTVGSELGAVDWGSPVWWLTHTDPSQVLTALVRLVLAAATAWVLAATVLYGALGAAEDASHETGRRWGLLAPRFLRRLVDGAAAVSVVVSAVTSAASSPASAAPVAGGASRHQQPTGPVTPTTATPGHLSPAPGRPSVPGQVGRVVGRHLPHPGLAAHNTPVLSSPGAPETSPQSLGLIQGTRYYVVRPGDCLSVIAERHLGDWRRDAEIDELNRGRIQPDGRSLVDDHWIYPGWFLVMPPDAIDVQVVPVASASTVAGTAMSSRPSPVAPDVATHPAGTLIAAGAPDVPAVGVRGPHPSHGREAEHQRDGMPHTVDAGIGLMAAAAFGYAIRRRRRDAMHDRPTGWRVRRSRPRVEDAELLAGAKAGPDSAALMRRVDWALQVLGRELLEMDETSTPSVALVRATPDGIEVMVDPPTLRPPRHFEAVEAGSIWVLDPSLSTEELEALAEPCWPFLPTLVTAGETPEGTVLVNLEHAGVLRVSGDAGAVRSVLAEVALELRCQPWCVEAVQPLILGEDAAGRALSVEAADAAVRSAARCAEALGEAPTAAIRRAASLQWPPTVAVCGPDDDTELVRRLCESAVPDRSALVVVSALEQDGPGWVLTLGEDGGAVLSGVLDGGIFTLPLVRKADQELIDGLNAALERPLGEPPPPNWLEEPGAALPDLSGTVDLPQLDRWISQVEGEWEDEEMAGEDDREGGSHVVAFRSQDPSDRITIDLVDEVDSPVRLTILGPIGLEGAADLSAVPSSRRSSALAVVAFLATRGRPATADEIAAALWPTDSAKDNFGEPRRKTVMNVISRARSLLGEPLEGASRLLLTERGYVLSGEVGCDWSLFEEMTGRTADDPVEEAATLRAALELVKGPPLAGSLSGPFFEWVSAQHLDLAIEARVVDSAERLGGLALELDDAGTAEWAVRKGLELDPAREELYRVWMHVAGRGGRPDQVEEIYRRLCRALQRHLDAGMAPSHESERVRATYSGRAARV